MSEHTLSASGSHTPVEDSRTLQQTLHRFKWTYLITSLLTILPLVALSKNVSLDEMLYLKRRIKDGLLGARKL